MNISVRSGFLRKLGLIVLSVFVCAVILEVRRALGPLFPSLTTLTLYLTPMALGVAVMTYVWIHDREALVRSRSHEEELEASRERFAYLYKSSPVPYINIDTRGKISMINLAAMRLFNTREEDIIGRSLYEHLTLPNDTKLSILIHQLENQITIADVEVQFKTVSGDLKWVLLSAFADGRNGEELVSLMDITRQKEVDIAKTEFVTLASHQLRTPIAAVRWNLELLQTAQKELSSEEAHYYHKISKNVERLASLVNDFLHVSKLELGTFASSLQTIELSSFILNSLDEFDKSIKDKKLTIDTAFTPQPLEAEIDPRLLRIVVDNLVSNAIKYTPAGGTIRIRYEATAKDVRLSISDTGIGIPADELDEIFNRFYRATNAEKQHAEGTGLGLYIIKQAVRKMSGSISVESLLGKGTTFTLRFPR